MDFSHRSAEHLWGGESLTPTNTSNRAAAVELEASRPSPITPAQSHKTAHNYVGLTEGPSWSKLVRCSDRKPPETTGKMPGYAAHH